MYAAWHLGRYHDVALFEREQRVGGHIDTHDVDAGDAFGPVAVDTGFIVFNRPNYPLFSAWPDELGVASRVSDMSFCLSCRVSGLEYNATSLNRLFCQRRNLFNPRFIAMVVDIVRFYRGVPVAAPVRRGPRRDRDDGLRRDVPAAFFEQVLGRHMKYSSAYWPEDAGDLDAAEERMLALTCERAGLEDGQRILELGCGSLTLWMASNYRNSRIVAVSNSASQRAWILREAGRRDLDNVDVLTCDVNRLELRLEPGRRFDRAVSVEMFEHVRNYQRLLHAIANRLKPDGLLFVHVFCHCYLMYPFETQGNDDWMARNFFTGGLMPAADTLSWFQDHLTLERRWLIDGRHYARTARAWLDLLDRNRDAARAALAEGSDRLDDGPDRQLRRWRMFFMACEELFAFDGGREWLVAHYRFRPRMS